MNKKVRFNPDIHKRKSIRLKGYDYSKAGLYFITILSHEREHLFGKIIESVRAGSSCPILIMQVNEIGKLVSGELEKLPEKYKHIDIDKYVIMPNHIHFMLEIQKTEDKKIKAGQEDPALTLGRIIGYFKYQTTKLYNEVLGVKNEEYIKLWHRNYYENIVRSEEVHNKVSEYIKNNPLLWKEDKYFE